MTEIFRRNFVSAGQTVTFKFEQILAEITEIF